MGVLRKDKTLGLSGNIRGREAFVVSHFLEHRRVGGFVNTRCFPGAPRSGKGQHSGYIAYL